MYLNYLPKSLRGLFAEAEGNDGNAGGTETNPDPSLKEILQDESTKQEDKKEDASDDEKVKDTPAADENEDETEDEDGDDLSLDEVAQAKNIFKVLKDPEKGKVLLEAMAKEAGLISPDSTKKEKQEAVKTIAEIVKDHLGEDYKFLNDRLGKAFEAAINHAVENHPKLKSLNETIANREQQEKEKEASTALTSVIASYENANEAVQKKVLDLVAEMPKPEKMSFERYFKMMFSTAASDLKIDLIPKNSNNNTDTLTQKRNRNRQDASLRMASESRATPKGNEAPKEYASLREAVEAAANEIEGSLAK